MQTLQRSVFNECLKPCLTLLLWLLKGKIIAKEMEWDQVQVESILVNVIFYKRVDVASCLHAEMHRLNQGSHETSFQFNFIDQLHALCLQFQL